MTWYADRLLRIAGKHDADSEDEEIEVRHLSDAVRDTTDPVRREYLAALLDEAQKNAAHHRARSFVLRGMAERVGSKP